MDQIEEELPQADIVALCLPSTPETRHFFDQRRLALTRRDCVLVNVGRGVTVDTPALCALLDQGHFGGLVLDVVDPEPLPMNNPLWGYDRVILTPPCLRQLQPTEYLRHGDRDGAGKFAAVSGQTAAEIPG